MGTSQVHLLGIIALLVVLVFYYAGTDVVKTLSPQGCRMSWMSPSYVLQTGLDRSWSPLAGRYSLWLYREVGWEGNELRGSPVIFIPGNAGSSHQVRSIASSATRQFYANPYDVANEFRGRGLKPLDFFAVEFNEDLSAFHGPTLDAQTSYTGRAVDYILSLYPSGTQIIVLGHSMGGVVATSLLPHANISAVITMSTPHTLPPARFDRRIERIYEHNRLSLLVDPTPILSLCGGATDLMIPSESCILPPADVKEDGMEPFRRTVFTSALEGSWTGVGHREMVWCHQVRWRVARASLELGGAYTIADRGTILETWLRDGHTLPPGYDKVLAGQLELREGEYTTLPADDQLVVRDPVGSRVYLLSSAITTADTRPLRRKFVLHVSQGSIPPTSPQVPFPLQASVFVCTHQSSCTPLQPTGLRLIPNATPGRPFPVPDAGSDESQGVVVFEADVELGPGIQVAVRIEHGDGRAWVVGGFAPSDHIIAEVSPLTPFLTHATVSFIGGSSLLTSIQLPRLLSNSLIVYHLAPRFSSACTEPLLSPLLQHTSHPSEIHYYPQTLLRRSLLHSHAAGPYVTSSFTRGLNLTLYSSGEPACFVEALDITLDWWSTIGRLGVRYAAPAVSWAVGVAALIVFDASRATEAARSVPSVGEALSNFTRTRLLKMMFVSLVVSFVPFPASLWLGNRGEPLLALIAPVMLVTSTGLVCVSWWLINILTWLLSFISRRFQRAPAQSLSLRTNTLLSLGLVCAVIFLLVPWQVGFLGCWIYHLYTCSSSSSKDPDMRSSEEPVAVPLIVISEVDPREDEAESRRVVRSPSPPSNNGRTPALGTCTTNARNENEHLLLLMTWLLPLTAPILAVWVRTLLTAGFTTPFDGDHNFLLVLPFFVLVGSGSSTRWLTSSAGGRQFYNAKWRMLALAIIAFALGPRQTYLVFESASAALGLGLLLSVLERR